MGFGALNKWRRVFGSFFFIGNSNDVGSFVANDPNLNVNAIGTVRNTDFASVSNLLLNGIGEDGSVSAVIQNVTQKDIDKGIKSGVITESGGENIGWMVSREISGNETKLLEVFSNKETDFVNYKMGQIPSYANDAAADADARLLPKSLYKINGDRAVYQKP